jgi:hypothetical protein
MLRADAVPVAGGLDARRRLPARRDCATTGIGASVESVRKSTSMSVRGALLVCLLVFVVATTGALAFVWERSQEETGRTLSTAFLEESQRRAQTAATTLIGPVEDALELHWRQMRSGVLKPDDPDSARLQLLPAMRALRHVNSTMVGSPEGYQLLVMAYDKAAAESELLAGRPELPPYRKDDAPSFFSREFRRKSGETARWILWDSEGRNARARFETTLPGYDPAERPWCLEAVDRLRRVEAEGGSNDPSDFVAWTNVYALYTTKTPGVSGVLVV